MVEAVASIHTTPVFRFVLPLVLLGAGYATAVVVLDRLWLHDLTANLVAPSLQSTLALAVSILLVFRTNTSYDRWWEGRKLWGQLVNDSRTLSIKASTLVRTDVEDKSQFIHLILSFSRALEHHLRDSGRLRNLPGFEHTPEDPSHVPAHLVQLLYERVQRWKLEKRLDNYDALILDRHLANFLDICGGCERIRKTPIALSYLRYVRQALGVYMLMLPWGIVHQMQWWTVPLVALAGYFIFGLEIIAEHAEDPFGFDEDDLDIEAINAGIERTLRQILSHMEQFSEITEKSRGLAAG